MFASLLLCMVCKGERRTAVLNRGDWFQVLRQPQLQMEWTLLLVRQLRLPGLAAAQRLRVKAKTPRYRSMPSIVALSMHAVKYSKAYMYKFCSYSRACA